MSEGEVHQPGECVVCDLLRTDDETQDPTPEWQTENEEAAAREVFGNE